MVWIRVALVALALVGWRGVTSAGPQPEPTVGELLLLAESRSIPLETLQRALSSDQPSVRLAAARLIAHLRQPTLGPLLQTAAQSEADGSVKTELEGAMRWLVAEPAPPVATPPSIPSRMPPPWVGGLLASTAAAAKCPLPESPLFGYAQVTYGVEGRPGKIAVDASQLPDACRSVLIAIARTTYADPTLAAGQQWLVLPFSKRHAECTSEVPVSPVAVGIGLKAPTKRRDVKPIYPPDMLRERVSGMVILRAIINREGCVVGATIMKDAGTSFGLASLRAVSGWEFEPALKDGQPVDISMTVTTSFNLK